MRLFIISLETNQERRASAIRQARHSGKNWEIIDGVVADWLGDEAMCSMTALGAPNRYGLACVLSHIRALRRMIAYGLERAIIVEDDWIQNRKLDYIGDYVPMCASYVTLSRISHPCAPVQVVDPDANALMEELDTIPISTVGYIITAEFAQFVLDNYLPINGHIDRIYRILLIKFGGKCYRVKEAHISGQQSLPSILHHDDPTA